MNDVAKVLSDSGFGKNISWTGERTGEGRLAIKLKYDVDGNSLNDAKDKVETLNQMISAIEENYSGYASSDIYSSLIKQRDNYQEYVDNIVTSTQTLLNSAVINAQYDDRLKDFTVDSAESLNEYRNILVDILNNTPNLESSFLNGDLTIESATQFVDSYISTMDGFSDYYNDWASEFASNDSVDSISDSFDKTLTKIEDKVQEVKNAFNKNYNKSDSVNSPTEASIKNQINEFNKWIDSLSDEDKELVYQIGVKADDTSLWTLTKWQSELIRVKTGAVESEEALQKFYDTLNDTSEGGFTDTLNGYKEQLDSFKDYLDKIDTGSITDDEKLKLALDIPELASYINDTDSLKNALQGLIDTTNGGIDTLIEEQIESLGIEGEIAAESLRALGELVKSDNFKFDIDSETEKFNNLYSAMKESVSATGMTSSSMSKVNAMFSELEGYDPSKLFERTENGIHMNTTALRELTAEYENQKKADISNEIEDLTSQYNSLTEQINNTSNATESAKLYSQREDIQSQITDIANLAAQYEGLTSSFNQWTQAQSTADEDDMFTKLSSGLENMQELYESGRVGTDDFRAAVQMMTDIDVSTASIDELKSIYQPGFETMQKFFTGNSDGLLNFLETAKSVSDELGKEWVKLDENGNWTFDFGIGGDEELAQAINDMTDLQMSTEEVQILLRALSAYGFDINLDSIFTNMDLLSTTAEAANDKLKSLGKTDIDFDFNTSNLDELNQQIEQSKELLDKFRNADGTINMELNGAEEAQLIFETLVRRKQELNRPAIMSVDTSKAVSDIEVAIGLLKDFQSNYNETEIKADIEQAQINIQNALKELESIPDDVKTSLGLDDSEFQEALTTLTSTEIDVEAGVNLDESALGIIQEKIQGITPEMMVNAGLDATLIEEYVPEDKDSIVVYNVDDSAVNNYKAPRKTGIAIYYPTLSTDKLPTLNGTAVYNVTTSGKSKAQGTAHAVGTAFVKGNWGTKKSEVALTGELGQELISYGGKFWTVGDNGAEFSYIPQGAIVFNAEQTKEIFEKGKINSRGKSFANGTAYSNGSGSLKPSTSSGNNSSGSSSNSGSSGSSSNNSSSSSSSSVSDTAEEFKEIIDWIEIAIDRIERAISTLDLKAQSIYRSWSSRNDNLKSEISKVSEEITLQQRAYNRYLQEADSIGLSEDWAEKVRNGKIDIEAITDEDLNDKISQYREWYEKAIDCRDAVEELTETVSELYETAFENVSARFDGIINAIEHKTAMIEEFINRTEEKGYITSAGYYETLIENERANIQELEKEKAELISAMQNAVDSGAVTENSEAWYEMASEINDVSLAIEEANTKAIQFGNSVRDIQWKIFDLLEERISFITQEADFLIRLMENDKLYDDRGQLTGQGMSTMGLHGANYNVYMAQADKYAQEMLDIDKKLSDDPYNQDLFERRQELLELQQEMILAANDEKEAIRDMVQEGIELELDSLKELIDEYENALDAEKDLYDYQKKISSQTADIAKLEKQLSAYINDNSEETKAKVQQLKVSLAEAKENLQETQYDKYVSDQKKLLDELYNEYETVLNQRLDDLDALIRDMIQDINDNSKIINDTLISEAESVGYTLSDNMLDIWNSSGGTNQILTTYGDKFLDNMTSLNETVNSIGINIQNMIGQLNKLADTDIDAVSNSYQNVSENINSAVDTTEKPVVPETTVNNSDIVKSNSDIKIGEKINAGNAKIYAYIGAGGIEQYYKSDPVYTVLSEKDGYIQVRHHKLSSGISGWFKKSDVNAYKNGVYNLKQNELAWTQENGVSEAIIRRSDGAILTPLNSGDSVLNGKATSNLFDFANSPVDFIYDNLFDSKNFGNTSKVSNSSNNTTVNFENVNFNLPDVKNYNEFINALQHDKRFENMIRAMTTDRMFGGSSLKKYHL
ncbi:MAG: hypothetical protein NC548_37960 [Lachnospiraceae bacterium]|nr:hypothetical protein [Lachnospiraceae bacterium]